MSRERPGKPDGLQGLQDSSLRSAPAVALMSSSRPDSMSAPRASVAQRRRRARAARAVSVGAVAGRRARDVGSARRPRRRRATGGIVKPPRRWTPKVPAIPTGSSGSPDRIASSAAPALKGESSPVRVRVSSGKTISERPPRSRDSAASTMAVPRERVCRGRPGRSPPPPWTSRGSEGGRGCAWPESATGIGQHGEEHEDVVEALVVGRDDEARAGARAARRGGRATVTPETARIMPRPARATAQEPLAPRGGTSAMGIAGRPKRIVATDDHDPDAEASAETARRGIVAEGDKSRRVRRLHGTEATA